ncbi:MAG TPA: response regulator [Polyangiaceae bacterium]
MISERTVLVVEDNPLTLKMLRITLESEGYSVIEAGDGRTALAAAEQGMPALILQDLILPDMNGFELVRRLRALPGGSEVPILALSGFLGRIEEAQTAQAGFTALLVKPVEPSRLLDTVKPYFPQRASSTPLVAGERCVLVVDDDLVQLKLARLHLEQLGFEVAAAGSTAEALRSARAQPPDIVLADVLMPDLDGFQLCFELRRDPELARVPVVLTSAWYQTEQDKDLAHRVGANALVLRTPDFAGIHTTLLTALKRGAPELGEPPSVEVQLTHSKAVIRQLERQLTISNDLARRCTLQAAQISLLSGVADALTQRMDTHAALRDVLAATLDAAGISKGAIFLRDPASSLTLRHAIGFSPSQRAALPTFFGHSAWLEQVVEQQATTSVPSTALPEDVSKTILSRADVASAQIVPLVTEGRGVGAILLGAKRTDVTNDDSIAFARAMGNQLAQSLELASSFSRLAASEERYRAVTESANDAIAILTDDGIICEVNRSLERTTGVPRDQLIGRHIRELAAPGHEHELLSAYQESLAGSGRTLPRLLQRADGTQFLMEFSNKALTVAGEKLVFSIGRDVTEQVQAHAQLMVSDRMVSMGTLAAGVAHEINNPLAAVTTNLDFAYLEVDTLGERFGAPHFAELQEALQDAREAANRVRVIVRDLKIFSRGEEDQQSAIDVRRVLESSVRMAWNEIRHRAELVRDYHETSAVIASESRLGQVFLNLLVNAAQAIPEGRANANRIRVATHDDAAGQVIVEIEDTGGGIPPETMQRLFTPFFSTKPIGVGTGLGLSICQRIVSELGGQIRVQSHVGQGTTVHVCLPAAPDTVVAQTGARPAFVPPPRRGRILVIDDEFAIGIAVRRALAAEHEVVTLTSATQALERILAGDTFDVILCDVMMPVMTGAEFHAALSARAPDHAERIVFLTGGAFTAKARAFLDQVKNPKLDKPFEVQTLKDVVNTRLR